jgi:hypothetical protein
MNNFYNTIHLLEANDAQVLSLSNFHFDNQFTDLDSLNDYLWQNNLHNSTVNGIREALILYLDKSSHVFDGDSYVYDEELYILDKEEEEAFFKRIKLAQLGDCYIYPTLGRIVYTTYDYDYISGEVYTKHRIQIKDYLQQLKDNIKVVEESIT